MSNCTKHQCDEETNQVGLSRGQTLDAFLASVEQRAYRMAYIATSSKEDALDIVQDAMIMLVNKYSQRDHHEWPPLFYRIVQNTIRDWYRRTSVRNKFRQWFSTSESSMNSAPNSNGNEIAQDWESQAMAQAVNIRENPTLDQNQHDKAMIQLMTELNQLPIRQQQAFMLRCWEGLDTKQTAAAMNITEGSVKTHYSRATHTLRKLLGDHYGE